MNKIKALIKSKAFLAFGTGFVIYIAVMLPDIIKYGGVIYGGIGDYNTQVVPFAFHLRSLFLDGGIFGWDWGSGLGSCAHSSYAIYNLFRTFTFLYLLIPTSAMSVGITVVAAVKFGTGAMLAYFYIRRYVTNPHYAVIGGMLYAFSSFTGYNLVYHFADSVMLFPLLLIGIDELCLNRRHGAFAISIILLALTNYYFFFGQAVFCVIYFVVRCFDKEDGFSFKKLGFALAEAVLGCGAAMFLLLPVFLAILSSGKATGLIRPESMLLYKDIFDYLKIIQSAFMVPDPFGFISLFPENDNIYPMGNLIASVAAFIPLFSCAGVISFLLHRKKAWQSMLIAICVVMAFVPVLNSVFSMMNSGYYARWYYMPMLIGIVMSVKALEDKISFKAGIVTSCAVLAALGISQIFISQEFILKNSGSIVASLPQNLLLFGVTALSLAMLIIIVKSKRDKDYIAKLYIFAVIGCYSVFGVMANYFLTGVTDGNKIPVALSMAFTEQLPENVDTEERIALENGAINYNLIWGMDSVTSFNSLYDNGYIEFLDSISMRNSAGVYQAIIAEQNEICDLLSVKYLFERKGTETAHFGAYTITENSNFIPMGFTYDSMISADAFNTLATRGERYDILMRSLVTATPEEFADILPLDNDTSPVTDEQYAELIRRHRSECCTNLHKTSSGLTAEIELSKENIVFFSASVNDGWSAFVDGKPCEIHNVNNGMIGVRVPAGKHSIELRYTVNGLTAGIVISAVSAAALAAYIVICAKKRKKALDKE